MILKNKLGGKRDKVPIIVQKYGGSSVADAERMKRVAARIIEKHGQGFQMVVVVSAMGDVTDDLIETAKRLSASPPQREMDMLLATGEQQSAALLAMTLCETGQPALSLSGPQAGVISDGVFGKARIRRIETERIRKELDEGKIIVVAGFQGLDDNGDVNTLGRGGSDTTAAALAIALQAEACEIFTDVSGVYTAAPRFVPRARKLDSVSYDEMLEMASLGAGVLHPRSVELAKQFGMKLTVRSSFNNEEGTVVREEQNMPGELEKESLVCGVAKDLDVLKFTIFGVKDAPGQAAAIFSPLAAAQVNVDMIVQSGAANHLQDISFTTGKADKGKAVKVLECFIANAGAERYKIEENVAKLSIVGAGMISRPGVAAKMFGVLAETGCNINIISTSEIKISCIIEAEKAAAAAGALHTAFGLDAQ